MKTAMQWLEEYLNTKVLPCTEGNDYVYGMNVAHENLINYVIPALLEKEKEQIMNAYSIGFLVSKDLDMPEASSYVTNDYYNQAHNQNK